MSRSTKKKIPFAKPHIGSAEIRAVKKALKSGWLTSGKENQLFEEEFAQLVECNHGLSVNSATAGLHLALDALNVGPGDGVITTAYTFTATAEVIHYQGATPLLVDVQDDYNISPQALKESIEKATMPIKAVILVHMAGLSCDWDQILPLLEEKNIAIIEDAAHSFPVKVSRGWLGAIGRIGVYSFYANKTITTGEGGMVVCNDPELYKRMKTMRLHGIDRDIWNRYNGEAQWRSWEYDVVDGGFKYNMTNFQAAMGRVQLKRAQELNDRRHRVARAYQDALKDIKDLELPPQGENHSWHLFILRLSNQEKRDSLMKWLYGQAIGTSLHFIPLPCLSFYQREYGYVPEDFPKALDLSRRSISIPIYPSMSQKEVKRVIQAIQEWAVSHG